MTKSARSTVKKVGIWLDHKEAFPAFLTGRETNLRAIGQTPRATSLPWVAVPVNTEQTAAERPKHQFHNFSRKKIKRVEPTATIYHCGPGEAKLELAKEIGNIKGPQPTIAAGEAADKLTENQIVAKVKTFLGPA